MEPTREKQRLQWDRSTEFIFTLLGYNIGLGMLWRFPYLCYRNGGGAFLVPFLVSCFVIAIPLYTFEIGLGQFTKRGRTGAWDRIPLVKGLGAASLLIAVYCIIPYMLIMAWCIFFFVNSFTTGPLPWTTCGNSWNTNSCIPMTSLYANSTSVNVSFHLGNIESTQNLTNHNQNHTLPQVEFWRNRVLRASNGFEDSNQGFNTTMFFYLLLAFVTVFLVTINGVKSSGKIVYFTASFPYVMLFVLLVQGLTLEGAAEGIKVFLLPKMEMLLKPSVWMEGLSQAFYVYGIGFPGITAFGSYNRKRQDFFKQSVFIIPCGVVTSLIMGLVTFSILGNLAHVNQVNITSVIKSGPGLVFQVVPSALSLLPLPQLWSVLFFLMLFSVAIDSAFGEFEGISTCITDKWPILASTFKRRALTNIGIGVAFFAASQIMLMGSGIHWFELFNYYGGSGICLIWVVTCESLALGWLWDAKQYRKDVKKMIGRSLPRFFDYSYKFIIPLITIGVLVMYCVKWTPLTIGGYTYPTWANVIGWMMSLSSILCIPVTAVFILLQEKGNFRQRWKIAIKSKFDFGSLHDDYGDEAEEKISLSKTEHKDDLMSNNC